MRKKSAADRDQAGHVAPAIDFIETHLDGKLDLERVASAVNYSKYHLHRMFSAAMGMTVHDYAVRRQLTEAAKLLVFSEKPIIEIALICGYESQQTFTVAFKAMYKMPPARYRELGVFYPLQLPLSLRRQKQNKKFHKEDIRLAEERDVERWMELVGLVIDGYPCFDERDYLWNLRKCIQEKRALILETEGWAVGVMAFSAETGSIEFMGVHPQYRRSGIQKLFLDKLMEEYLPGREISTTTFRASDRADTGYREEWKRLGFAERELLMEFGYPTQRLVRPPERKEGEHGTKQAP